MDDLFGLIAVVIYFIVIGSIGKKKNKQKRQPRSRGRRARFDQAFEQIEQAAEKLTHEAPASEKPVSGRKIRGFMTEGEDPCHENMLRESQESMQVPLVAQEQMALAGEGEDPCHLGGSLEGVGVFAEPSPVEHSPIFDTEEPDAFARDVLRGVVMSEILTRPSQRRGAAVMKRGA